ncbi:hypothetical protein L484_006821 [Morus notabilis]|uniref:Uncharacterized protein n=1 Tax=Morus notabilis TaxID=981085 RepID=W9S2L3_9ROSA|nr:hypothetical protein L484_006821 [Morus notabilis]
MVESQSRRRPGMVEIDWMLRWLELASRKVVRKAKEKTMAKNIIGAILFFMALVSNTTLAN